MKKKILFLIFSGFFFHLCGYSQSLSPWVISSSGGQGGNEPAYLAWTIGEPVITTLGTTAAILTQGFHQPELDVGTVIQSPELNFTIKAFPNPAKDKITLFINNPIIDNMTYALVDLNGKSVKSETIVANKQEIAMDQLKPSTYILLVYKNMKELIKIKIVKH